MNKLDLMVALSKDSGLSVTKATEVVNVFFGEMTDALVRGIVWKSGALGVSRSNVTAGTPAEIPRRERKSK